MDTEFEDTRPFFEDTRPRDRMRRGLRRAATMKIKANLWRQIRRDWDEEEKAPLKPYHYFRSMAAYYSPERVAKRRLQTRSQYLVNEGKEYRGAHHRWYDKDEWYVNNRRSRWLREQSRMNDEGTQFMRDGLDEPEYDSPS